VQGMKFFDTHAHLNSEEFTSQLPALLERARLAGVRHMVVVGTTLQTSLSAVALAQQHAELFCSVGIQPNYVSQAATQDWDEIVKLAQAAKVVALGETGLDRYWHDSPFEQQQDYFDRHLRLSQATQLPFIVHMRDCGADVAAMLREARTRGELRGVMHSFTGDAALLQECLELGLFISFAGMVTYKNAAALREAAKLVPADRILIETDSPYLSPHPVRSQRPNEPALLVHTASCLAEVRNVSLATFADQTWQNACRLFRIQAE
jgi:TatD DNase family protein